MGCVILQHRCLDTINPFMGGLFVGFLGEMRAGQDALLQEKGAPCIRCLNAQCHMYDQRCI